MEAGTVGIIVLGLYAFFMLTLALGKKSTEEQEQKQSK